MGKLKKMIKDKKGMSYPLTVALVLALLIALCVLAEFFRLSIIAYGVRNALQESVISVATTNYNEVYDGLREGYSGGYFMTGDCWEETLDYGDVYTRLDRLLGTNPDGAYHVKWQGNGYEYRVTKGAALAMKSRMLLYAASPLWNPANDKSKWEAAAKAAEEVMKLGYSLDTDYKGLFLNPMSSEIIFQRLYNTEFGHWYDWYNSTNGWGGYSCTAVLQEMVDSYEMEDGTMPDPALYTSATTDPWAGRDPRLYASVVCDGQLFRGTEVEFWVNNDGKTGGIDSEFGKDAWNYSKTHYIIRKFMDENLTKSWSDKGKQPWVYCRLAEIYLNYAEAMYHCGKEDVAREYVNYIRKRARGGREDILPRTRHSFWMRA